MSEICSCWLCGYEEPEDEIDKIEECGICGQDVCNTCGEWKDGEFKCANCLDNKVDDEEGAG